MKGRLWRLGWRSGGLGGGDGGGAGGVRGEGGGEMDGEGGGGGVGEMDWEGGIDWWVNAVLGGIERWERCTTSPHLAHRGLGIATYSVFSPFQMVNQSIFFIHVHVENLFDVFPRDSLKSGSSRAVGMVSGFLEGLRKRGMEKVGGRWVSGICG